MAFWTNGIDPQSIARGALTAPPEGQKEGPVAYWTPGDLVHSSPFASCSKPVS